jgi:hypothetical protein
MIGFSVGVKAIRANQKRCRRPINNVGVKLFEAVSQTAREGVLFSWRSSDFSRQGMET